MDKISIIVPCYNESHALPHFVEEINKVIESMNYCSFEILFIDDGSTDNTLEIIKELSNKNNVIRYASFSRNFGKEAAMYAGFKECTGDYIAIMDADLQDPPSLLPQMYKHITEDGYDSVATRRHSRKGEKKIRSFFSKRFYKIMNKISNIDIVDGARDFRLMTRQMLNSIIEISEYNRFSKGIFGFVGYKTKWISYDNVQRVAGDTKWSFLNLFKYSIEGFTAFSTFPLVISSALGFLFCIISLILILVIIVKTLAFGDPTSGWPSLACIIIFVSGIQLLMIGVIGQYLAKTYLEVKKRPIYIIKESNKKQ
ncbi:MAG: glycosyltransferase family 2 protein [Clostridia bacterium]|nr:glycosyltransferase family 2 protein [Clostridia bacterium]